MQWPMNFQQQSINVCRYHFGWVMQMQYMPANLMPESSPQTSMEMREQQDPPRRFNGPSENEMTKNVAYRMSKRSSPYGRLEETLV